MGFLKRIFGRSKWEDAEDDLEGVVPVWEVPAPHPLLPSSPLPGPTEPAKPPLPKFQPGAPAGAGAPPPKFQPGAPAGAGAPPPKFQPGAVAGAGAPPPKFQPGADPGMALPPTSGGAVPVASLDPAPETPRRVPGTREEVIDNIAEDDLQMPEELRGCRVVEETLPDGKAQVFYRGPDGFSVPEEKAEVLIGFFREELATITSKVSRAEPRSGYSAPVPSVVSPVEPRLMGGPAPTLAPLSEEVIDELGFGDDLPPELRGAAFVRRGGEFRYVTRDGTRLSKDMAEGMMERWEKGRQDRLSVQAKAQTAVASAAASARAPSAVPTMPWGIADAGGLSAPGHKSPPAPEPLTSIPPSASAPSPTPPSAPIPPSTSAPGPPPTPAPAPALASVPAPMAPTGRTPWAPTPAPKEPVPSIMTPVPAGSVPAAATFREETPARDIPAWRLSRGEEDGLARRSLAPITLADPTLETELDGPAVSAARHAAEVVRTKILADADGVFREELRMERLQQACLAEVERKRTKHRFEQLIQLSADAGQVLSEAWEGSRDRMHKDASRELGQDMLVLGLFNPMTLRDIDLAEFVTVARLRRSAKRRDIVAGEIARRVHEEVPTALHQYGMTRAFVDRVAAVAVVAGSAEDALRTVLEERADESIEQVTSEVMRRHGIWLPGLRDRLLQRLRPLIEGILSLMP